MSSSRLLERTVQGEEFWVLDDDEPRDIPAVPVGLSDDWKQLDPIDEMLAVLVRLGRQEEADLIESILGEGEEALLRAFVSAQWAPEWDSDEDRAYDNM